jgi:hypothetical protein
MIVEYSSGMLLGGGGRLWLLELILLFAASDVDDAERGGFVAPISRLLVELAADVAVDITPFVDCVESERRGICSSGRRRLPARVRRRALPLRVMAAAAALTLSSSSSSSSSETQRSQRIQPRNVPTLLQLTTETGDTRSWKMATKLTIKMMTLQTCCRMTVESATRGQKS